MLYKSQNHKYGWYFYFCEFYDWNSEETDTTSRILFYELI